MTNFLKKTFLTLFILLLLLILTIGVVATCVSPNRFKPLIIAAVVKHTGRQLTIDGDLSWSFYPYLGFKTGHLVLNNPATYKEKTFAEINQATVGIKLMPLLHGEVATREIAVDGLKLNLIKNADGTNNWQDLQALTSKQPRHNAASGFIGTPKNPNEKRFDLSLDVPSLDISDAQINWHDEQTKQTASITQFKLHAENISLEQAFPVNASFNFAEQNTFSGQASFVSQIKIEAAKQIYTINNLALTLKTDQNGQTVTTDIKGDVVANMAQQTITMRQFISTISNIKNVTGVITVKSDINADLNKQTLQFTNLSEQLANLNLNGNINVANFKTAPVVSGHLQAQPFDLKMFLQAIKMDAPNLQVAKMVAADFDFTATPPKTAYPIQAVTLQGKITIDNLQGARLKATNLVMQLQLQDGMLQLTSIDAALYQGNLKGQAKINLAMPAPQSTLQAQLTNVQAEPLLQDLNSQSSKFKIKGAGNIDIQATSAGLDGDAIARNLNGSGHFSFKNGQLEGINIGYLLDSALAVVKQQTVPAKNESTTNFGDLTGSFTIVSGILTNKDLTVTSPRFNTKGEGTINFVTQQINYSLLATPANVGTNNTIGSVNLNNLTLPIVITGSLSDPSIRLDAHAIVKEVAKQQLQNVQSKVQDKIRDQIKNNVGGQAGKVLQNLLGS